MGNSCGIDTNCCNSLFKGNTLIKENNPNMKSKKRFINLIKHIKILNFENLTNRGSPTSFG